MAAGGSAVTVRVRFAAAARGGGGGLPEPGNEASSIHHGKRTYWVLARQHPPRSAGLCRPGARVDTEPGDIRGGPILGQLDSRLGQVIVISGRHPLEPQHSCSMPTYYPW